MQLMSSILRKPSCPCPRVASKVDHQENKEQQLQTIHSNELWALFYTQALYHLNTNPIILLLISPGSISFTLICSPYSHSFLSSRLKIYAVEDAVWQPLPTRIVGRQRGSDVNLSARQSTPAP